MPDWIVTAVNTSALAGVTLFGMWGIVAIARFLGPKITSFFEAHINLIDFLKSNLTELRQVTGTVNEKVDKVIDSVDGLKLDVKDMRRTVDDHESVIRDLREPA